MSSRKQSVLGYFVVASLCLVVGFVAGQERFTTTIQSAIQSVSNTANSDNKQTKTKDKHVVGNEPAPAKDPLSEKERYIKRELDVFALHTEYMASMIDDNLPGVTFKLRNSGDRSVKLVEVTVFFQNVNNDVIYKTAFKPIVDSPFSFGENSGPLQPGEVWKMGNGRFYGAKSVPAEWLEGAAYAKVTHIEFADDKNEAAIATNQAQ